MGIKVPINLIFLTTNILYKSVYGSRITNIINDNIEKSVSVVHLWSYYNYYYTFVLPYVYSSVTLVFSWTQPNSLQLAIHFRRSVNNLKRVLSTSLNVGTCDFMTHFRNSFVRKKRNKNRPCSK